MADHFDPARVTLIADSTPPPAMSHAAALHICSRATDADDAAMLCEALLGDWLDDVREVRA